MTPESTAFELYLVYIGSMVHHFCIVTSTHTSTSIFSLVSITPPVPVVLFHNLHFRNQFIAGLGLGYDYYKLYERLDHSVPQ